MERRLSNFLNSIEGLIKFFQQLNYKVSLTPLDKFSFDFPSSVVGLIEEFYNLVDYNHRFQIYFAKTTSMRRSDFRRIVESFYRRFPQVNTLFIFTQDFSEVVFASPIRVAVDHQVKLLLRFLYVDPNNIYHTDEEVLENLKLLPSEQTPEVIWERHKEAFNIEKVTREFFEAYKNALNYIREELLRQKKASYNECHSFAQQLLSRIMFLYYIQKKGWLKWGNYLQDKRYISNLWKKYKEISNRKDSFYSDWLSVLFFYVFNSPKGTRGIHLKGNLPEEVKESYSLMPFLNGGLFTKNELDEIGFNIPDRIFELLFDISLSDKNKGFLERFNFTVREDTPLEVEVAVDPEMLGKVYESLISEEERGRSGIFYTPRTEIDLMCRLSLIEYLYETINIKKDDIKKDDIISLIFEPKIIEEYKDLDNLRKIKEALDKVKIVDPAVGSASFLVGMMNVLVEIHTNLTKRLENKEENLFALKQRIILENLYGVDVKDWAVMVGELRLWLSLIIETDEKYMDIYTQPLLPNLSFKIRQGDSLVEEIAGINIVLRKESNYISPKIKDKILELVKRKVDFFKNRRADLKEKYEIENFEHEIFKEIILDKIQSLNKEKEKINKILSEKPQVQLTIFGVETKQQLLPFIKDKEKLKKIEKELKELEKLQREVGKKSKKDYFLWEIDFVEVFALNNGFDIVIGNPPYVRQEEIAYPLDRKEDFQEDEWRERKREYVEKITNSVQSLWENITIKGRSNLYVYFYYQALSLLKPKGIFCFINSNAWLDFNYGAGLQEFLLKNMKPIYIIDNIVERTFESDVNTVIVLIKRPENKKDIKDDDILKFIAFKKPFENILKPDIFIEIEKIDKFTNKDDFRVFPKRRIELLKEGIELPENQQLIGSFYNLPYIGNKWGGKYLRAPEIYFKILEKGKGKFIKLLELAEIEGYIHGNNVGRNYPKVNFIESLEQARTIYLSEKSEGVIQYGVKKEGNSRILADLLFPRMIGDRFFVLVNYGSVFGQKFYKIILKKEYKNIKEILGMFLNSTLQLLQNEIVMLSPWGLGALSVNSNDVKTVDVLIDLPMDKNIWKKFSRRPIKSIFEELGVNLDQPIWMQKPNPLPDRKAIDDIVFDALGLTQEERKEVYWAVAELVKQRLEKARSVRKVRRKKVKH